jgi:hypothetical protein
MHVKETKNEGRDKDVIKSSPLSPHGALRFHRRKSGSKPVSIQITATTEEMLLQYLGYFSYRFSLLSLFFSFDIL